jgi:hypothetical protein
MNRVIQPKVEVTLVQSKIVNVTMHAVQCGIWVPTQHLLWDQGKPWKPLIELVVARPSGCKLTSSEQSGIKSASHNISVLLCFYLVSFSFFNKFFYNHFYMHMISGLENRDYGRRGSAELTM